MKPISTEARSAQSKRQRGAENINIAAKRRAAEGRIFPSFLCASASFALRVSRLCADMLHPLQSAKPER